MAAPPGRVVVAGLRLVFLVVLFEIPPITEALRIQNGMGMIGHFDVFNSSPLPWSPSSSSAQATHRTDLIGGGGRDARMGGLVFTCV